MNYLTHRVRRSFPARIISLLVFVVSLAAGISAQTESRDPFDMGPPNEKQQPKAVREFIAKKRAEKSKKEHDELLRRGEELLALTGQLEEAFERNKQLTRDDQAKLDSVEELVERIRKSLGGDGDGADKPDEDQLEKPRQPGTEHEAMTDLKQMAVKLVDELKKTSRFTISVLAIQSSNNVLKIVRFLRLKK
ncbi:MAG: hypothetical protein AB7F88_17830 [Pyrinomonadaceae bacterium]